MTLSFDFRRKNQTDHPALMLIFLTGTGDKIFIDLQRDGAKVLDEKTGTVNEVLGSSGGDDMGKTGPGGPFARNTGLPRFGKGSEFWIAAHGVRSAASGPYGSPNDGIPLSNIIEMVVE